MHHHWCPAESRRPPALSLVNLHAYCVRITRLFTYPLHLSSASARWFTPDSGPITLVGSGVAWWDRVPWSRDGLWSVMSRSRGVLSSRNDQPAKSFLLTGDFFLPQNLEPLKYKPAHSCSLRRVFWAVIEAYYSTIQPGFIYPIHMGHGVNPWPLLFLYSATCPHWQLLSGLYLAVCREDRRCLEDIVFLSVGLCSMLLPYCMRRKSNKSHFVQDF